METLGQKPDQDQDQDQISESRVSRSDLNRSSEFEASRLYETEIFVKEVNENAIGDISVVKISEKTTKMTTRNKAGKSKEFKELENVGVDEGVESMVKMGLSEEEEEEEEEEGEVSNEFGVGDFVWVKIKSYPWWPGQIFSPVDASAKAGKYRRRNRLLVACFGDGTFAWCYPSQLKSFRENFDKFENQSSSKNFVIAVEEAVNEFGRSVDFEMGCSCLPVECRPVKSVAVNAGIKEGVTVPDGGIGELSIAKFEPAEFLAELKYIAQVVSVSSSLELLALKCRLSGFYRAKGYNQLMEYHLPMRIVISEDVDENGKTGGDDGKNLTANVNGSPVEADWLSSSTDNGVGSTGITMSRRMTGLSEDILLNSKKQRNVSDLMLENLNAEDDLTSEASPIEEPVSAKRGRPKKMREPIPSEVGKDTAEEVAVSAEMASGESKENTTNKRGRPKKIREPIPSEVGKDTAEEVEVSPEMASGESKENMASDVGHVNGVSDEVTTPTKTRGRPKKITEPIPCKVGDISVEKSDISQMKASGTTTSMETKSSKADLSNGVTEEAPDSGKPGGRPKRKQNTHSDIGNDAVKKSGISSKQVTPSGMDKKLKSSNVGDANGVTEERGVSVKARGRPKKARDESNEDVTKEHKTKASEGGSDAVKQPGASTKQATPSSTNKKRESITVGDANGATEEGSVSVKGRGRPKKRKEESNEDVPEENKTKASEVASEEAVITELPFSGKKSMELRRKKTQDSEVRKDPDVAEESSVKQIAGSRKRKEKADSRPGTDSGIVGEGFNDSKQASTPKRPKEIKLPEPSLTGESSDDEDDDSGSKEGSKSNVSLRERKKSKYLSPPYTLIGQWRRDSAADDSRKKSPRSPHSSQERFPPMVKCIGLASETQPSKDAKLESGTHGGGLSPLPIESNATAHEILSDFRSAALDPLYLTEKQSDDTVKGFFNKFRNSSYQEGSDYNNQLGGGGSRKRVSFEVTGNETRDLSSEDASEGKKRKKKDDEVLPSPKKSVDSNGEVSVAALLLTFTSGASLPSKDVIIKAFRPFGDVNESETEVIEDSGCAQVVFANRSDAEAAYKSTDKITSFGSSVASFRLRYLSAKSARPSPMKGVSTASEVSVVPPPPLLLVRQNLQKAETVLEKLWDNLSSEMKTSLDDEIKGFLGKVTSMGDTTSS